MMYGMGIILMVIGIARGGLLRVKVTGTGQFSADKSSATLQLNFQPNNPGQSPTASPTAGVGSQPSQGVGSQPSKGVGSQPSQKVEPGLAFCQEGLEVHNRFRATHGAPPMTLDKTMCEQAASYAADLANKGTLVHSSKEARQGQGENLSMGCSSSAAQSVTEAVTNWYNEVCAPGYVFGRPGVQGGAGHFTQVVWKASTKLGIGRAEIERNGLKCAYIVGRYQPMGNFNTGNNDYQKNVLKGSFKESYCNTISSSFKDNVTNASTTSEVL